MRKSSALGCLLVVALNCGVLLNANAQMRAEPVDQEMVDKIKREGTENSQIMNTISFLTDVHGPRLTASPLADEAAEWTIEELKSWGLENCHLEFWGPFGRGWTLEGCSVNMVSPRFAPMIAHVKSWSPSTPRTVRAVPIYLDAETPEELEAYRGKLGRAIVLISPPRQLDALFDPPATRKTDEELLRLANAATPVPRGRRSARPTRPSRQPAASNTPTNPESSKADDGEEKKADAPKAEAAQQQDEAKPAEGESQPADEEKKADEEETKPEPTQEQPKPPAADPVRSMRARMQLRSDMWQMAYREGAAVILEPGRGDGGNVFVASVTMPLQSDDSGEQGNRLSRGPRPWATDSTDIIPQAVMAAEHYNQLVRMLQKGAKPEIEVDILTRFHKDKDAKSFNIIAEIPGTDLKDEIVMLGAHFDSWQAGTGATDNAVGCGVAMEAMRILKAIGAKPRRTVRLALWTGEEQGLLGSRAYVAEHFGEAVSDDSGARRGTAYKVTPEYEKISAYYNLDNGTGAIRGIYLQGNEQLRPIFRSWLAPFADMNASTVSASNTGGTDHQSFDAIGIPGFQFIQDKLEYDTRTHHSSMDVYDRIQEEDVKNASIIMASFVYNTAMRDEPLERKPLAGELIKADTTPTPAPEVEAVGAEAVGATSEGE